MRATSKLLALALTAALQPAVAGVVSLNFEDLSLAGQLGGQYANQGISFTGSAWAVSSAVNGCNGGWLFGRTGSCGALLLGDPDTSPTSTPRSFTIDVAGGFVDEFDFVYGLRSASNVRIAIYDDIGGTGNLLQSLTGPTGGNCASGGLLFCQWANGAMRFDGTARSVTITGADQRLMLDDLKFITAAATPNPAPEPASIALALAALGAAAWTRKRSASR